MWKDPIVDEIHRIREEWAAKFNYNAKVLLKEHKIPQFPKHVLS